MIQPWIPLDETEIKPLPVPDKSPKTRSLIQKKEGSILLERIQKETLGKTSGGRTAFYLLDETGKSKTTLQWVEMIQQLQMKGTTHLSFCIGSSLGFSEEIRGISSGSFSLGPQTLSHELARVVLLEQIYRTLSVIKGHPYHNQG